MSLLRERRRWDLNPRLVAQHTISSRADSAALALLRDCSLVRLTVATPPDEPAGGDLGGTSCHLDVMCVTWWFLFPTFRCHLIAVGWARIEGWRWSRGSGPTWSSAVSTRVASGSSVSPASVREQLTEATDVPVPITPPPGAATTPDSSWPNSGDGRRVGVRPGRAASLDSRRPVAGCGGRVLRNGRS